MRKDDADIQKPPLEVCVNEKWSGSCLSLSLQNSSICRVSGSLVAQAVFPKEQGQPLEKYAHTQIAVGARMACYHDEVKLCLPAILTPQHHLLFTFFHVDLLMKLEPPKPVSANHAFDQFHRWILYFY